MNKYEAFDIIEKQLCKEVCQIAEGVQKNQAMSMQELEKLDKIFHTWKSQLTTEAMLEAEGYEEDRRSEYSEEGMSGRRGRATNGRFVSRSSGPSYDHGYPQGYSDASGHYPMPYYEHGPRW